jgi:hypothetical protein
MESALCGGLELKIESKHSLKKAGQPSSTKNIDPEFDFTFPIKTSQELR